MRFIPAAIIIYILTLGLGLGLPVLGHLDRGQLWWLGLIFNTFAILMLVIASFFLMLLIAKKMAPEFWWMAQVANEDIYEFEGVYFVGSRQSRQKARINRLLFGVDEKSGKWNLLFGLLFLALVVPHLMGGHAMNQFLGGLIPQPPRLSDTLHRSTLSVFPAQKAIGGEWRATVELREKIQSALQSAKKSRDGNNKKWFTLAQLHLLSAFTIRDNPNDPYRLSPGDRVLFDRGQAAQAVSYLNRILEQPEQERVGWSRGANALIGFFHLSDGNYGGARSFFEKALAAAGDGEEAGIPRYQISLLLAQASLMEGRYSDAERTLEVILTDDRMPRPAYPLAMEHFAETARLSGDLDRVTELLGKAQALYEGQKNEAGLARVLLRQGAFALDSKAYDKASDFLSRAAAMAQGVDDGFTVGMVDYLLQEFPKRG